MLVVECGLLAAALVLAFTFPTLGARRFERTERVLGRLAQRRGIAVIVIGVFALVMRAALLPITPVPEPIVHDEFGYLLAADTFSHGRLTNPTHPMWIYFETFSVLQRPTYQCYAQPAQGLILAFGKLVFGHPFWGVWLSAGLMCAAICWMLQGWVPESWALVGGAIAVFRIGALSYWANSYWGGAVGATGGALVLGALPRIVSMQRCRDALLMGLGFAILANSRPYEGVVLSIPVAVALFTWILGKHRPPFKVSLRQVVIPVSAVLGVTALASCYYFWRVTGHPFRMPYQVAQETYGVAPYMVWQNPRPEPMYHHLSLRKMYAAQVADDYRIARSAAGLLGKAVQSWLFFVGPALTLPFLIVVFVLPYGWSWKDIDKDYQFLIITGAIFALGVSVEVFFSPHYAAPATALIIALTMVAMRRVSDWQWRNKPVGLALSRAIVIVCAIMFFLRMFVGPLHIQLSRSYAPAWYQQGPASFGLGRIAKELEERPGRQLVIVRYQASHDPFKEWVHNDADIDSAKVVWAHDMAAERNRELINYFRDRQVLLIQPDENSGTVSDYHEAPAHQAVSSGAGGGR